jgi:hypothetical protein
MIDLLVPKGPARGRWLVPISYSAMRAVARMTDGDMDSDRA